MFGKNRQESTDPWDYYYELRLFDPMQADGHGYPMQIAVIGLRLTSHRHTVKTTTQLNATIAEIMDPARRHKYLDGSNYFNYDNCCSRCGGGFHIDHCIGCRRPIQYDGFAAVTGIAVPPRVRAWLETRGHVFTG